MSAINDKNQRASSAQGPLSELLPTLASQPSLDALLSHQTATLAVSEAGRAAAIAGLSRGSRRRCLLAVTATRPEAEALTADLRCFLGANNVDRLPAWETLPFERVSPAVATMGRRCRVLHRLSDPERCPAVLVASARAVAQQVDVSNIAAPIEIALGDIIDQQQLIEQLVAFGYQREHQVEHIGEMAVRGSIVDVYPSTAQGPLRIDLWDDEIDRLTSFSVGDQRSTADVERVELYPARELRVDDALRQRAGELMHSEPWGIKQWQRLRAGELFEGMESWWPWLVQEPAMVVDLLPEEAAVILMEPKRIAQRGAELVADEADLAAVLARTWNADAESVPKLNATLDGLLAGTKSSKGSKGSKDSEGAMSAQPVWLMPTVAGSPDIEVLPATGWHRMRGSPEPRARQLQQLMGQGYRVLLCAPDAATGKRLEGLLNNHGITPETQIAPLRQGAAFSDLKLVLLSESDITGRRVTHRPARTRSRDQRRFFEDLEPGRYVVHHQHGVARFEGMVKRRIGGHEREYLLLAYRGHDKLYVPSDQVDSIRHYTGGESPKLSRMGGSDWAAARSRVRSAVSEVAQELVVLYQQRMSSQGWACDPDTPWQRELEDAFEYVETRDQLRALEDVKADMERAVPMDRLVVGDVGFGKTEIAVRAAFKAVQGGKQVAILVPTTLLAHQHTQTLTERYAPFPVRVEMLSRFLTVRQARQVVAGLASGEVDVVVGTHRLLSKDVRFRRLGLLVVDEEQRFGVRHKEAIKSLRSEVDVLTLTATPVPRTMEMSLTGIRDMSLLHTPPADRQPILTYVGDHEDRPIAEAIRRELLRDGQVFFVHNRVFDIHHVAARLQSLVPEARIAVAHGQMDEGTLERVVLDFADHEYDVLVCTTIIESGIDMPTVNTLVVDRADRLGLGQLHQIRGRVGRSGRRAYAYLLHPQDRVLSEQAYERLKTIGESTALGSGYRIAMRDLEIRGAGNLLGEAQSGHIAAVGYDLYCQLVLEAVAELKGETTKPVAEVKLDIPGNAHLPTEFMAREASRLEAYRRLAAVTEMSDVEDIRAEWSDRFGPPPEPAEQLLAIARLRVKCLEVGLTEVSATRRGGGVLTGIQYQAWLAPVRLPASRQVRLRRLYGPGAIYKEALAQVVVPLKQSAGPIVKQLIELVDQVIAVPQTAPPKATTRVANS